MIARFLVAAFLFATYSVATAAVTVKVDPLTPVSVSSIGEFSVGNNDMDGLKVIAYFSDNTTTAVDLFDGPSGVAEVLGHFHLKETNDTFYNNWTLTNLHPMLKLTKLVLEGGSFGDTVFDLQKEFSTVAGTFVPGDPESHGTTGSHKGLAFIALNADAHQTDVTATYSNIVQLGAAPPIGDVWTTLTIEIHSGLIGSAAVDPFSQFYYPFVFQADTDVIGGSSAPIPEPSSLALLLGLGSIGAWQIRRGRREARHS